MSRKIKKGDTVVVISGLAKNMLSLEQRTSTVLKVDHKKQRVTVENINMRRKSVRRGQDNPDGGFVEREFPIHLSNVMLKEEYDRRAAKRDAN